MNRTSTQTATVVSTGIGTTPEFKHLPSALQPSTVHQIVVLKLYAKQEQVSVLPLQVLRLRLCQMALFAPRLTQLNVLRYQQEILQQALVVS